MTRMTWTLAWWATALAAVASAAGLFTASYRDLPAMVEQAHGADLATLLVAVPLLAASLWTERHGSERGRIAAVAGLCYLVYTYSIAAFQVVVNPLTPLHIAILGLACWALAGAAPALMRSDGTAVQGLPRRTTAGFLSLIVVPFAVLWLGQIGGAIVNGGLPESIAELQLPTSAVYALDLAFVLPAFALTALLLVRDTGQGRMLGFGCVVFSALMAISIGGMFVVQATHGTLDDPALPVGFGVIAGVAAVLARLALRRTPVTPVAAIVSEWDSELRRQAVDV